MSVILETQKAVYSLFSGNAPLMAVVSGVYDYVPEGAVYPYVTIGDIAAKDVPSLGVKGYELNLEVNVYSDEAGRKEALGIVEMVRGLLDNLPLTVTGFLHVATQGLTSNCIVGETVNGKINFKIILTRA